MNLKDKNDHVEEQETVDESTAAASLKPGTSKSELLSQMMKLVSGMKKEDLSAFLTKTINQVGKEDDSVPDTSGKNQASISMNASGAPKPEVSAVREDMEDIFSDQDDLSEEFKSKAATLFEAAVANHVSLEVARIEEEFEAKVEEQVSESVEELHSQVESYIDYVADKWVEENKVALESNYRSEMTENFINGLKKLFEENYVEVPEEKVDLIGEMEERVRQLEESLEETEAENIRLSQQLHESQLTEAFDDITEDLVDTQVEKFRALAESLSYDNVEEYRAKLEIIKEEYFSESSEGNSDTGLINEDASIGSNEEAESEFVVPEEMKSYIQAITQSIKK